MLYIQVASERCDKVTTVPILVNMPLNAVCGLDIHSGQHNALMQCGSGTLRHYIHSGAFG